LHLARTPSSTVAAAQDQRAARVTGHEVSAPHLAVLRDTTDEAAPDQDAVEREAAGSTPSTGDSTTVASAPARAGASAGAGQIAERDLEEMVRRLYPRLRRSLSSELLVARERAGTLADLR
jgi:hypothetical protein